jgi:SAM-dependent methyltransferase
VNDDWTVDYFDEPYTDLHPFPDDAQTDTEVSALVSLLPAPPARVLGVACGQGRHSVRLAQEGYDVVGVDTSTQFLADAQAAASERGVHVELHELDMRSLEFEGEFDGALNLFSAWGYYDDETNLDVLRRIARALRPGGVLLLDVMHRDFLMHVFLPKDWMPLRDGGYAVADRSFDPVTGVNTVVQRWQAPDGERWEREHRIRVYTGTELNGMLRASGLIPVEWYGGFRLDPFTHASRRMFVRAQRTVG